VASWLVAKLPAGEMTGNHKHTKGRSLSFAVTLKYREKHQYGHYKDLEMTWNQLKRIAQNRVLL